MQHGPPSTIYSGIMSNSTFLVSDAVFTFLASKQNLERADFDPFGTIALMVKTNPSQLAYSIGSSAPPTLVKIKFTNHA